MYYLLLLVLVSCGAIEHNGKVGVEVSIDQRIEKYFKAKCTAELPGAPEEAITACTDAAVGEFLSSM